MGLFFEVRETGYPKIKNKKTTSIGWWFQTFWMFFFVFPFFFLGSVSLPTQFEKMKLF